MELFGVYAHSSAKVGEDLAQLVGLPEPAGPRPTDDLGALLALEPDCVVYVPLHSEADEVKTLLRDDVNVVTTSGFMNPTTLSPPSTAIDSRQPPPPDARPCWAVA